MEKFNLSSNFTKELIKKSDIHFFKNCTATNFTINQNNQTIEKITVQSAGKKNLIKAKYFVIIYGIIELYEGVMNQPGDNVAHFAHVGGALIGFLIAWYWKKNQFKTY